MTNDDVLKQLGLYLTPAGITKLMANADIICGTETPEGSRCGIHNGMCEECVPAWLKEEASADMLQLLDSQKRRRKRMEKRDWRDGKLRDATKSKEEVRQSRQNVRNKKLVDFLQENEAKKDKG